MEHSDLEWDLAKEINLMDEKLQNTVIEVEQDKPGLQWLEQSRAPLNPTQRDTDPAPFFYISALEKYAKVKVQRMDVEFAVKFRWMWHQP